VVTHQLQVERAQDSESLPAKDRRYTAVPHNQQWPLCVISRWPAGKIMWIACAVHRSAVHAVTFTMQQCRGIFELRTKFE